MEVKLKQHFILFIIVGLFVHLGASYMEGTLDPEYFSKEMRECEMIFLIFAQALAHYGWINRENIIKEIKK